MPVQMKTPIRIALMQWPLVSVIRLLYVLAYLGIMLVQMATLVLEVSRIDIT